MNATSLMQPVVLKTKFIFIGTFPIVSLSKTFYLENEIKYYQISQFIPVKITDVNNVISTYNLEFTID